MPPLKEKPQLSFVQIAAQLMTRGEFKEAFQKATRLIQMAITDLNARIDARLAQVKDGARGPKGEKGDMGPQGPQGIGVKGDKGDIGPAPDTAPLVQAVTEHVTPQVIAWIEANLPALGASMRDGLELLPENEALKPSAIAGLESYIQKLFKEYGGYMLSGGQSSISVMQSGTLKVQTAPVLNFTGAGAPTITTGQNGVTHLDFPTGGGGGGGLSILAVTGTVDDSNTSFTTPSTAQVVVVNGASYRNGKGVTISSTNVTLDNPVGTGGDIYALG